MSDFDDDEWLLKQIKNHRKMAFPLIAMGIVSFWMLVVRDPDMLDKIVGLVIALACGALSWFVWRDPDGLIPKLEQRITAEADRKARWAADNKTVDAASESHDVKETNS